jgi:hypothetical protein
MDPNVGDMIELLTGIQEKNLSVGAQGAVVHCHSPLAYEVEFTNDEGETVALVTLLPDQFIIVWRAETQQWVSAAEQAAALVASLPAEAGREVVDFARFLATRTQQNREQNIVVGA